MQADISSDVPAQRVVYLHGFRSSPRSVKAQRVMRWAQDIGRTDQLWVPALPASPAEALALIESTVSAWRAQQPDLDIAWIGSSLGGYYATVMAERFGGRAVLLNPAIRPYDDLVRHVGRQTLYFSDEEINFIPAYLDDLRAMQCHKLTNLSRYCLVAELGDEVLDARLMIATYQGAHQRVVTGGDHALSDFEDHVSAVMSFVGWGAAA